jgi:hypothetical protein
MPSGSKVVFLITAVVAVALVLGGKCVTATGVGMATGAVEQRQQQQQQQQDWSGDWVGSATNWPKELPPGLVVHFHIGRMPVSNNKCTPWTQQFVVSVACTSTPTSTPSWSAFSLLGAQQQISRVHSSATVQNIACAEVSATRTLLYSGPFEHTYIRKSALLECTVLCGECASIAV